MDVAGNLHGMQRTCGFSGFPRHGCWRFAGLGYRVRGFGTRFVVYPTFEICFLCLYTGGLVSLICNVSFSAEHKYHYLPMLTVNDYIAIPWLVLDPVCFAPTPNK